MNKPYELEERLIDFAVDVINVVEVLPSSKAGNHIANQLVRSGTSPAPNYGEARAAESKKDFVQNGTGLSGTTVSVVGVSGRLRAGSFGRCAALLLIMTGTVMPPSGARPMPYPSAIRLCPQIEDLPQGTAGNISLAQDHREEEVL